MDRFVVADAESQPGADHDASQRSGLAGRGELASRPSRWWRRPGLRAVGGFVALLLAIVVARFEVIDSPPYYDYAIGLWSEADFLADTHFDYYRLRYVERHTFDMEGGRRSYMTSVMPGLVAVLMVSLPDARSTLIAYHLLIFACAAGVVVLLYHLLWKASGRPAAWLVCLAVLTTPVFSTQIDMANMEMPLILCVMLAAVSIRDRRFGWATLAATAAFFIKATGIVVTLALITQLALLWTLSKNVAERPVRRRYLMALVVALAALAFEWLVIRLGGSFGEQVHPVSGSFWFLCQYWFPDLLFIILMTIGIGAVWFFRWLWRATNRGREATRWRRASAAIYRAIVSRPHVVFAFILTTGMIVAVQTVFFVPRYAALVVPLVYLIIGTFVFSSRVARTVGYLALIAIVGLNLWNWNGVFYLSHRVAQQHVYGPFGVWLGREHSHYERSHEYLEEHRSNLAAVHQLEARAEAPVFAGHPFNYFLTLPRLGYVKHPVRGYSTVGYANAPHWFRSVEQVLETQPDDAIFVWVANGFNLGLSKFRVPLPEPGDEVLYDDGLPTPLLVYRKRQWGTPSERRWWYLSRLWPNMAYWPRIARFLRAGQTEHTLAELYLRPEPRPQLGLLYGAILCAQGKRKEAAQAVLRSISELHESSPLYEAIVHPPDGGNRDLSYKDALDKALKYLEHNDVDGALPWFLTAVERRLPDVHVAMDRFLSGLRAMSRGEPGLAADHFKAALAARDDFAAAHYRLGMARLIEGHLAEARFHLQAAVRLDDEYADPHVGLGIIDARSGALAPAEQQFAEALRIKPSLKAAKSRLRRVRTMRGKQAAEKGKALSHDLSRTTRHFKPTANWRRNHVGMKS